VHVPLAGAAGFSAHIPRRHARDDPIVIASKQSRRRRGWPAQGRLWRV